MNKRFELLEAQSARIVELGELIDQGDRRIEKIGFMKYQVDFIIYFNDESQGRASNTAYAFSPNHAYQRVKGKAIIDILKWEEKNAQR